MEINLIDDFKEILKSLIKEHSKKLKNLTYEQQIKNEENLDKLCLFYLNLKRRLIEAKPRKIYRSKEFRCPKGLETNLNDLKVRISNGEDLTPFLSRQIKKIKFPDAILNEWGIYHLHLGGFKAPDEFSGGLNNILFAMFDDKNAYLIQILTHKDWTNKQLICIVHNNWPELIKKFKTNLASSEKISDNDRKKWRYGGINTPIVMDDGTTYICPGGGMVITQYSIFDKNYCNHIIKNLKQVENEILNKKTLISNTIIDYYKLSLNSFIFKLKHIDIDKSDLEFKVQELNSGLGLAFKGDEISFYKL
jgi:hypothetical protein